MKILNRGTNSTSNSNNETIFKKEENTFGKKHKTNIKKIYEQKNDSEPEIEESQYTPEEDLIEKEKEKKIQPAVKRTNKIFDYLNKDAKRNRQ